MGRALAMAGLLVGTFGLIAQFTVSIPFYMGAGKSLMSAIIAIFSFFTILTNAAVTLVYLAALHGRPALLRRAGVRAALAMSIVVVAIVYHFVLADLWQPQGLHWAGDVALHYIAPAFYIAWWAFAGRTGRARFSHLPLWLVYPLAYLVYAMLRGWMIHEYPYPFLDLAANGAASVAISVAMMLALFAVVGLLVIWADRLLPTPRQTEE